MDSEGAILSLRDFHTGGMGALPPLLLFLQYMSGRCIQYAEQVRDAVLVIKRINNVDKYAYASVHQKVSFDRFEGTRLSKNQCIQLYT